MSPRDRSRRVTSEVEAELGRLDQVIRDLAGAAVELRPECSATVRLAVAACLRAFYTGCEAALIRLLRLGGEVPHGKDWHQALLVIATAPVPGARGPLLSPETVRLLFELMRFRHFFRSSYGVELDPVRLAELAATVPEADRRFRADIAAVLAAISEDA